MPIFEQDEPITPDEMKRQQKALNERVARKEWKKFCDQDDGFDGGDCWDENECESDSG